jgi:outer membrane autotransporter protein
VTYRLVTKGSGTASITNGGKLLVDSTIVRVGRNAGSVGTLTVTGSGSNVSAENATVYIGYGGSGTVDVEEAAAFKAQATDIGGESTGTGTLTIDGEATTADLGNTTVGDAGEGTLNITGGATVATDSQTDVIIGNQAGSTGAVTVSGEGSSWTIDGTLSIGVSGAGTLTIQDGDTVSLTDEEGGVGGAVTLGEMSGSTGTLIVNGTGSQLDLQASASQFEDPALIIGNEGRGNLVVENGADVTLPETALGESSTGSGSILIQGSVETEGEGGGTPGEMPSSVTIGGALIVGDLSGGDNSVTVMDGGELTSGGAIIANQAGSVGAVTVDGAGSQWLLEGGGLLDRAIVVGLAGTGTFTLSGGATMEGQTLTVGHSSGGTGTVTITGADTALTLEAPFTVGQSGTGTVSVTDSAVLTTSNSSILGAQAGGNGTVNVSGTGAIWNASGGAYPTIIGLNGTGTLNVSDGASLIGATMVVGSGSGSGNATVTGAGSLLQLSNTLTVNAGTSSAAEFTVSDGGKASVSHQLSIGVNGVVDVSNGGNLIVGLNGFGAPAGTVLVGSTATLTDDGAIFGNLTMASGSLVDGTGTVNGTFLNGGTLTPGDDPGTFTVVGNYTQGPTGVLNIEVEGTTPGSPTGYSVLHVTGNANIGGTIALTFLNNYKPVTGQTYDFLTVGGTTMGAFNAVSINGVLTEDVADTFTADSITITNVSRDYLNPQLAAQLSSNQQAVASSLNTVANSATGDINTVLTSIDNLGNAQQIGVAFDQLSPQRLTLFRSVAFNNFAFAAQQLDDHVANLRDGMTGLDTTGFAFNDSALGSNLSQIKGHLLAWQPAPIPGLLSDTANPVLGGIELANSPFASPPDRWSAFITGNVVLANLDGNADASASHYTTGGVTLGADYSVDRHWTVGALFGYNHTDADLDNEGSRASIDTYSPGLYAAFADGGWYANGMFNYGYNSYTEDRNIVFPGVDRTAHGTPEGNQYSTDLDGGYGFRLGKLTVGPSAGLDYVHLDVGSFSESNAGAAGLNVQEQGDDSLRGRLGFDARWLTNYMKTAYTYHLSAHWQHEFMANSLSITSSLETPGITPFTVTAPSESRDSALLDAGVDVQVASKADIFLDYQAQAGQDDFFAQSIQAGVKIGF